MDVTFNTAEGRFNYRVCAVILRDGRLLAMHDERSPYFYLPGGRVKLQETAEDALLREVREELAADGEIVRALWLNQGFFTEDVSGERFHEICVYFLVAVPGLPAEAFTLTEGIHTHRFEWLAFDRLKDEYFYPTFLKEEIFRLPETLELRSEVE